MAKPFCHPFVYVGLLCVLIGAILYAGCASDRLFPFGGSEAAPDNELRGSTPSDPDIRIITENIEAKYAVTGELIAERLTLGEAIAQFRALDARRPPYLRIDLPEHWGRTVEERYAVCVVIWAKGLLEDQSAPKARYARLDTLLREYLDTVRGTSRLRQPTTGRP